MRRWPPIVWPLMTFASLLILMGASGQWDPPLLLAGGALAVAVLALSVYLATRGQKGKPTHRAFRLAPAGLVLFYVCVAAAASLAGSRYVVAALAAGLIPLAALELMVATTRAKTAEEGGRLKDASGDRDDPFPGIGLDSESPLGDTEDHSEAIDSPKAHDHRRTNEHQVQTQGR